MSVCLSVRLKVVTYASITAFNSEIEQHTKILIEYKTFVNRFGKYCIYLKRRLSDIFRLSAERFYDILNCKVCVKRCLWTVLHCSRLNPLENPLVVNKSLGRFLG